MGPRITTNEQKKIDPKWKISIEFDIFLGFSSRVEDLQIYLSKVYDWCCECSLFSLIARQPAAASRWSAVTDPSWQLRETIEWSEQR